MSTGNIAYESSRPSPTPRLPQLRRPRQWSTAVTDAPPLSRSVGRPGTSHSGPALAVRQEGRRSLGVPGRIDSHLYSMASRLGLTGARCGRHVSAGAAPRRPARATAVWPASLGGVRFGQVGGEFVWPDSAGLGGCMPLMACPPRWGCAPRGRLAGTRYGRTDHQPRKPRREERPTGQYVAGFPTAGGPPVICGDRSCTRTPSSPLSET